MRKANLALRKAQEQVLSIFSKHTGHFALAGGTALEIYYLHHRFSADLDFFSPKYGLPEINSLVCSIGTGMGQKLKLESEFLASGKAKVRFYMLPVRSSPRPLKIDFVEDVFFLKPTVRKFDGVSVYGVEDIYMQKIAAVSGVPGGTDEAGRPVLTGRREEGRDAFDIYMLSKKIKPLHIFLKKAPQYLQMGAVHWYRTFSRQELKLSLLDLDIYDKKFDSKKMIIYLESEIKKFMKDAIGWT